MDWKNRIAILYKRISEDDQSRYSLIDQDERLRSFCQLKGITITKVFWDDFSSKTFDRPGWKEMITWIKKNRGTANLLLFTNWSRFSRSENMGETYFQIANLGRMGLEVQAIEQPVDLSIPEMYHLQSIYITSPMVENLRRASNTRFGIRRSLKMGRWCNNAPFGYRNTRDDENKPVLKIDPEKSKIIEEIFRDYLSGSDPKLIIKRAIQRGLKNKGNGTFMRIITNPVYAGLIRIREFKDEPEQIVKGIHQSIVSEDIFYAANKKWKDGSNPKPRIYSEETPLRGTLRCDNCGNALTGGRSRGKGGGHWYYYRCLKCHGQNFSCKKAHSDLGQILSAISLQERHIKRTIEAHDRELKIIIKERKHEAETLLREVKQVEQKLASLESKYISNKLDFETYQKYFPSYRGVLAEKRMRLDQLSADQSGIIELYQKALPQMQNLNFLYEKCNLEQKHELLRLIFFGGLFLSKQSYRTPALNPLFSLEAATDAGLRIGDDNNGSPISAHVASCRQPESQLEPENNQIELLLRFVMKIAA